LHNSFDSSDQLVRRKPHKFTGAAAPPLTRTRLSSDSADDISGYSDENEFPREKRSEREAVSGRKGKSPPLLFSDDDDHPPQRFSSHREGKLESRRSGGKALVPSSPEGSNGRVRVPK
jgi:hypothetical protein